MRVSFFLVWLMLLGSAASAEVLTSKEARSVLFSTKNEAIQLSPALSKADQALIKNLVPLMEKQMRTPVWYYSSIAYSPDEGLVSEALQGAFNFHNVDAADRAA
ncbi:MAG: hypothetical protein OXQ92_00315, partial [Boseongicola sp.]|nr:hypothetical protein [Boseongicola sp.]